MNCLPSVISMKSIAGVLRVNDLSITNLPIFLDVAFFESTLFVQGHRNCTVWLHDFIDERFCEDYSST